MGVRMTPTGSDNSALGQRQSRATPSERSGHANLERVLLPVGPSIQPLQGWFVLTLNPGVRRFAASPGYFVKPRCGFSGTAQPVA